jgi:hypothetical protein
MHSTQVDLIRWSCLVENCRSGGSANARNLAHKQGDGKREPMAAYWFGGLEGRLLRLGESGLMSTIG